MTGRDDKKNELVNPTGNTNLIGDALNNLNNEQLQAVKQKAADEALRLQAKQIEQDNDFVAGQRDLREHVRTWDSLEKDGKLTRHKVVSEIKTATGKTTVESRAGASTCFVATAAYDDNPYHKNVVFLRAWRDTVLCKSKIGSAFIAFYWKVGPKMAAVVSKSKALKHISRFIITVIVSTIALLSRFSR